MDESQNYLAVSKEVVVTVAPKEVTVTPGNASKIYGRKTESCLTMQKVWQMATAFLTLL
ncbi:MAG: hypothetical protein ACLS61_14315 [Ruminococcus sp.]